MLSPRGFQAQTVCTESGGRQPEPRELQPRRLGLFSLKSYGPASAKGISDNEVRQKGKIKSCFLRAQRDCAAFAQPRQMQGAARHSSSAAQACGASGAALLEGPSSKPQFQASGPDSHPVRPQPSPPCWDCHAAIPPFPSWAVRAAGSP